MTCKLLHFLDVGGVFHIDGGMTFIQIGFNAYLHHHVPKELPNLNLEGTPSGIQVRVILPDRLQDIL